MVTSIIVILILVGFCILTSSVMFIVPLTFLGLGVYDFKRRRKLKKNCTETVYATVVDIRESYTPGDSDSPPSTSYFPVWSYNYMGQDYEVESLVSSNNYNVGDSSELMINPDEPYEFYDPKDNKGLLISELVLIGAGAVALVVVILSLTGKINVED